MDMAHFYHVIKLNREKIHWIGKESTVKESTIKGIVGNSACLIPVPIGITS
jgi:hypothetical protein